MWNDFINEFCKVEFLCFSGEPNWLGWLILIVVPLGCLFTFLMWYGK
jgi:hypothetical protein